MSDKKIDERILEKIRELATRIYPRHNYEGHIIPVVKISLQLYNELRDEININKDVIEVSAYMHDAGRVKFGCYKHEITGSYYVAFKLWQYGLERSISSHIVECVLTHKGTKENPPKSIEAKIVANADALSHFECVLYEFGIKYSNCKNLKETISWLEKKLSYDLENKLTIPQAIKRARIIYEEKISPMIETMKEVCKE